jgi:hypothetical protein
VRVHHVLEGFVAERLVVRLVSDALLEDGVPVLVEAGVARLVDEADALTDDAEQRVLQRCRGRVEQDLVKERIRSDAPPLGKGSDDCVWSSQF